MVEGTLSSHRACVGVSVWVSGVCGVCGCVGVGEKGEEEGGGREISTYMRS